MKVFGLLCATSILIDQIQCILVLQEIFKGKSVHLLSKYFVCKYTKVSLLPKGNFPIHTLSY